MNIYAITAFIGSTSSLLLGALVFLKNRKNPGARLFALLSISIFVWVFGCFMESSIASEANRIRIDQFLYTGAAFAPTIFLHFSLVVSGLRKRRFVPVLYCISLVFLFFNWSPLRDVFILDVQKKFPFRYIAVAGPLWYVYLVYFAFCGILPFFLFWEALKTVQSAFKREQLKYMFVSLVIIFIAAGMYLSLVLSIASPPIDNLMVGIFSFVTAYAILRYRLMDISVAFTRTGIFVGLYTVILGIPFAVAGWGRQKLIQLLAEHWLMLPLVLMAALATVGPFIYIFLERKAEARLLRDQRRYQETLKQASVGMTRIRDMRRLLDLITHIVTKTVRISYASIYLFDKETQLFHLQVCRDKGREPAPEITLDSALVRWLSRTHEPLLFEEVKRRAQDNAGPQSNTLVSEMERIFASVVIPSFLEDRLTGFIVLGDKLSGQIYTPEDLSVFQVLASQAALAIENAQFYADTRQMQEQIAQAEKMATIGTMADGLSHQINNRFYALSLIAGDTIDTLKNTDTRLCSSDVQEMIQSINRALERIQTNVIQGGEVVKGILKYTRKGEEGLEALGLDEIIDGTLDMVQYKVRLSDIEIARDYPRDLPRIKGNRVQLQEVFFNLIDNANDAMSERKQVLREEGFRGRILIFARPVEGARLEVLIEDNGLGVKEENAKKLFTPFFTTKTSNRKGTGLGLYVINKIITETHKGTVRVESQYGVGTRFILSLPAA